MAEPVTSRISHETRDISVRAVTWFAAMFIVLDHSKCIPLKHTRFFLRRTAFHSSYP